VTTEQREVVADWLIVGGALALFGSLFLTWSHQFSPAFLAEFGASDQLRGVPRDPTAWQVYSAADLLLALLAAGLVSVALMGTRGPRSVALVAAIIALVFTLHALSRPPTNGANIFDPALSVPDYFPDSPGAGFGETVAIAGLVAALAGLGLSFTAD
jgi:hypothetical protein